MPMVAARKLETYLRPVYPRAKRMALIVASVPLLVILTFSIEGTQRHTVSAIVTSTRVGIP